ncbi:phosphatidic acid phosphatase type 2/haloperoxidase [Mycena floridula]|nr:phosphatidic acid phosphatase type 2/haloperoxidase [Mycena floridula]
MHYRWHLALTYGLDWFLAIVVALISNFPLDAFQQIPEFDLTDTSIQFSFHDSETVPNKILVVFLVAAYLLVLIGHLIFSYKRFWDLHTGMLALTLTYSICGTLSQVTRVVVGRPRPDFIARCNPLPGSVNAQFSGLSNITICQTPFEPLLKDGMRSFFSGHAILSAAGFGFVSLYWAAKLHLFNQRAATYKLWLVSLPMLTALWISFTRVADRRHHWEDAATGFFLGLIVVWFVYRQFYPPLGHPECHLPYVPRIAPEDVKRRLSAQGLPRHPPVEEWQLFDTRPPRSLGQQLVQSDLESSGLMTTPFEPERHTSPQDPFMDGTPAATSSNSGHSSMRS